MKDEALRLALEALEEFMNGAEAMGWNTKKAQEAINAIKQAFEQPEPEPVAWGVDWGKAGETPCVSIIKRLSNGNIEVVAVEYGPKRKWQGLTDDEIDQGLVRTNYAMQTAGAWRDGVHWAQMKLKEKNNG